MGTSATRRRGVHGHRGRELQRTPRGRVELFGHRGEQVVRRGDRSARRRAKPCARTGVERVEAVGADDGRGKVVTVDCKLSARRRPRLGSQDSCATPTAVRRCGVRPRLFQCGPAASCSSATTTCSLLRKTRLLSRARGTEIRRRAKSMLGSEPPAHTRLRTLVNKASRLVVRQLSGGSQERAAPAGGTGFGRRADRARWKRHDFAYRCRSRSSGMRAYTPRIELFRDASPKIAVAPDRARK